MRDRKSASEFAFAGIFASNIKKKRQNSPSKSIKLDDYFLIEKTVLSFGYQ